VIGRDIDRRLRQDCGNMFAGVFVV
jgi:hypothetical protein